MLYIALHFMALRSDVFASAAICMLWCFDSVTSVHCLFLIRSGSSLVSKADAEYCGTLGNLASVVLDAAIYACVIISVCN